MNVVGDDLLLDDILPGFLLDDLPADFGLDDLPPEFLFFPFCRDFFRDSDFGEEDWPAFCLSELVPLFSGVLFIWAGAPFLTPG